jgi:hypothetical protein
MAHVVLKDWRGARLPFGGATVQASVAAGSTASVVVGTVTDHGDGSYSFPVTAGTTVGVARLRIVVNDGAGPVQLAPDFELPVTGDALWLDHTALAAGPGGNLGFALAGGTARAGRTYALLAGMSGSAPGITLGPALVLPINPDPFFLLTVDWAASGAIPDLLGVLDGQGHKRATVAVPPGALLLLRQGTLTFAWGTLGPIDFTSNPARLDIR